MTDILDRIKSYKLEEIAARRATRPLAEVERAARAASPPRGFSERLRAVAKDHPAVIAEIKRASPSKGLIRSDYDPAEHARAYAKGGAACLSVLTDGPSFQGDDAHLTAARAACDLPSLRKDFYYDPYQAAEARALAADCVLIIMASVSDAQAAELEAGAFEWGMEALLEVHDLEEAERALALRSNLIGVNNRDLRSFETHLETTEAIAPAIRAGRPGALIVAESGLHVRADLDRMTRCGADAFLIGESLMRRRDLTAALGDLLDG